MDFVLNDKSEIFMYSNEEEYNAIRGLQNHIISRKQLLNLCLVLSFTDNQFV